MKFKHIDTYDYIYNNLTIIKMGYDNFECIRCRDQTEQTEKGVHVCFSCLNENCEHDNSRVSSALKCKENLDLFTSNTCVICDLEKCGISGIPLCESCCLLYKKI